MSINTENGTVLYSPVPRIEIRALFEKNGTFSKVKMKRWMACAIGVNGKQGQVPGAEWANAEKKYIMDAVLDYAAFTGWPVVEIDDVGDRPPEKVR